jgi:cold shock CspA family protein
MAARSLIPPRPPQLSAPERRTGHVSWWCRRRSIGFIQPHDDAGTDDAAFVHGADLRETSHLVTGQLVSYREDRLQSGPRARDVVPCVTLAGERA